MEDHDCCYIDCPEEGTIHIGANGGDSHWICSRHLDKWNADRNHFLADGGGCEMEGLGEPLRVKSASRKAAHRNLDVGSHSTNEEDNNEKAGSIAMRRAKRLDRQNVPVRSDVFLHRLEPSTLEAFRRALEHGLKPSGLEFTGNGESIAIIRFTRPRAG